MSLRRTIFGLLVCGAFVGSSLGRLLADPPQKKEDTHWAYQPVRRPGVPGVRDPGWIGSPVDAFVLARLEKHGLKPAPRADRRSLLRRVYLDLIGLPPSPEEMKAFLEDRSPDAFRKVVDGLLARPQYGER